MVEQMQRRSESRPGLDRPKKSSNRKEERSKEKEDIPVVETVENAPGIIRRFLFLREFQLYRDILDASNKQDGMLQKNVPAVHTVVESHDAGAIIVIGNDKGEELGYVNLSESGVGAYDWSIANVYQAEFLGEKKKTLSAFLRPSADSASLDIKLDGTEVYPILDSQEDNNGNRWFQIAASLTGQRKIGKPVWVQDFDADDKPIAHSNGICVTKGQVRLFSSAIEAITQEMETLSKSRRGSERMAALLLDMKRSYLRLMGVKTRNGKLEQKTMAYLAEQYFSPSILQFSIEDIARMDDEAFEDWLSNQRIIAANVETPSSFPIEINGARVELHVVRMH